MHSDGLSLLVLGHMQLPCFSVDKSLSSPKPNCRYCHAASRVVPVYVRTRFGRQFGRWRARTALPFIEKAKYLRGFFGWAGAESNCRHEDFQSLNGGGLLSALV